MKYKFLGFEFSDRNREQGGGGLKWAKTTSLLKKVALDFQSPIGGPRPPLNTALANNHVGVIPPTSRNDQTLRRSSSEGELDFKFWTPKADISDFRSHKKNDRGTTLSKYYPDVIGYHASPPLTTGYDIFPLCKCHVHFSYQTRREEEVT